MRKTSNGARVCGELALLSWILASQPLAALSREETPPPSSRVERFSYSVGARLATDLRSAGYNVDVEQLIRGLRDGLSGSLLLSEEEMLSTFETFAELREERLLEDRERLLKDAVLEAEIFLAENRRREGVVSLRSGLQYEILREGSGPVPSIDDRVSCHYRGTLVDGTAFDDTYRRERPMTFVVANVIAGWEEALQMMPVGSRWKLYIPPDLAYGEDGFSTTIPPHAALIFDVELLAIEGEEE